VVTSEEIFAAIDSSLTVKEVKPTPQSVEKSFITQAASQAKEKDISENAADASNGKGSGRGSSSGCWQHIEWENGRVRFTPPLRARRGVTTIDVQFEVTEREANTPEDLLLSKQKAWTREIQDELIYSAVQLRRLQHLCRSKHWRNTLYDNIGERQATISAISKYQDAANKVLVLKDLKALRSRQVRILDSAVREVEELLAQLWLLDLSVTRPYYWPDSDEPRPYNLPVWTEKECLSDSENAAAFERAWEEMCSRASEDEVAAATGAAC